MTPAVLLLALALPAATPPARADEIAFFETHVRPLLAARCVSCHGAKKSPKGGLRLDTAAGIRRGGESGAVLNAENPEGSLLLRSIRYNGDLKMPPGGKLPPAEIARLERWIQRGAALPDEKTEAAVVKMPTDGPVRSTHWAFQPMRDPPVPSGEAMHPIDRFLAVRLRERGLTPAPLADRRTLLRRVTFDLTGLPPTPDEVDAFLADRSPNAFVKVVERLLASPAYGERWGRHWLDVARYADSNGMDENLVQATAWRYRDYVIAAFNRDLPYDRFVTEQLAGDLAAEPTPDGLVATGFLALGPKMLAEDDPVKMQMDIVDEQIDTVGKTFLGLTLGCARCHDHKYDPISTADYYALAGIFRSTRVMDNYRVVARWFERPVGTREQTERLLAHRRTVDAARQAVNDVTSAADEAVRAALQPQAARYQEAARTLLRRRAAAPPLVSRMAGKAPPAGAIVIEAEAYTRGNAKKEFTGYGEKIGVIYNAGALPNVAEYDVTVMTAGVYQLELRHAAAEARPVQVTVNGAGVRTDAAGDVTGTWFPDSQRWSAVCVVRLSAGTNTVRLFRDGPFPHLDKLALVPHDLPRGVTPPLPLTADAVAAEHKIDATFLQQWADYLAKHPTPTAEALAAAVRDPNGPFALPKPPDRLYSAATRAELQKQRDALARLEKETPTLPEAMGATEGTVGNVRVHLRGNHLTLGAEVPRRFPRVLTGDAAQAIDARQSGRRELAAWLTRPDHPLTARVLVNRVWHWHFGDGLVRSPDNFGLLGDRPTHPELLDWLARRFVEDSWSIKTLHRRILTSAAYQRSAAWDETAATRDPDNRLHGRWSRQRLDAEAIRDAILAVSGSLDRTMGRSLMQGANRGYVPGYPNGVYDRYDAPRRSVYLPVVRSMLYEVFQAFDFPDPSTPSGERASTTIAPQALFALNGRLMADGSRQFAQTLLGADGPDDRRVARAYGRAFGRPATADEVAAALDLTRRLEDEWARQGVAGPDRRLRAWQGLCRVLLSSSEFLSIE